MTGIVWKGPGRLGAGVLSVTLAVTPLLASAQPAAAASVLPAPKIVGFLDTSAGLVGTLWGNKTADRASLNDKGKNDASRDPGSLYTITKAIGAREVWEQTDRSGRALTGQGVTVAVLDSGVAAVPGLDAPGKLLRGPDLSMEANSDENVDPDTFGHGTHMASIIGARDPGAIVTKGQQAKALAGQQLGVAPDATLLALKMATTDGSTDVSQIIAALDWLVQHRDDNGKRVRVVNLSFGTGSVQDYQLDPLAAAAENAWRHGIVVVVSGGNEGRTAKGLTDPAIDPYVIAVGATEQKPGGDGWEDVVAAGYSSRGTKTRHVDFAAPGTSIVGLRAPGSFVDENHPEGLLEGDESERLFRGSGTSQAAAVVSGAAALLLQAYPELTPDQVKAAFVESATDVKAKKIDSGAGQIDVAGALDEVRAAKTLAVLGKANPLLSAKQSFPVATGTGSLELARGGGALVDPDTGDVLQGEVDVQGQAWDGAAWAKASRAAAAWQGGDWNGARWSGQGWNAGVWAKARWSGTKWSRARWSDASWDRARWSRARWSDAKWERARWSSSDWS